MVFVDGENLAIRYGAELKERGANPIIQTKYMKDVYVWSTRFFNRLHMQARNLRTHYYTCVQGDRVTIDQVTRELRGIHVEQPCVFPKRTGQRSKQVDISLATDMLLHAARRNYDTAILVAGDEDFVPLVKAVKAEGCQVFLWFIKNGLSPNLEQSVDNFFDIEGYLFKPND